MASGTRALIPKFFQGLTDEVKKRLYELFAHDSWETEDVEFVNDYALDASVAAIRRITPLTRLTKQRLPVYTQGGYPGDLPEPTAASTTVFFNHLLLLMPMQTLSGTATSWTSGAHTLDLVLQNHLKEKWYCKAPPAHRICNEAETGEQLKNDVIDPCVYTLNLLFKILNRDERVEARAQQGVKTGTKSNGTKTDSRLDYSFLLVHKDNNERNHRGGEDNIVFAFAEIKALGKLSGCDWGALQGAARNKPFRLGSNLWSAADEPTKVLPQLIKYIDVLKCKHSLLMDGESYVFMEWRKKKKTDRGKTSKYWLCAYHEIQKAKPATENPAEKAEPDAERADLDAKTELSLSPYSLLMLLLVRGMAEKGVTIPGVTDAPEYVSTWNNDDKEDDENDK